MGSAALSVAAWRPAVQGMRRWSNGIASDVEHPRPSLGRLQRSLAMASAPGGFSALSHHMAELAQALYTAVE
jgi:hypothetical protein